MDLKGPQLLTNVLTSEELEKVPSEIQDKITKYLDVFFDEYYKEKAAANRLLEYEQKSDDLQAQILDYEVKFKKFKENIEELQEQLEKVSNERLQLLEKANVYERDIATLRSERNDIQEERDSLIKKADRKTLDLRNCEQEIQIIRNSLKTALNEKHVAISRLGDIEAKEVELQLKDQRMEQERILLHKQIETLSEDLSNATNEIQNVRRKYSVERLNLETHLAKKTEELRITLSQRDQYKQTIDSLTRNIEELNKKMLKYNEDANNMINYYQKELEAKTKLTDILQSNCENMDMQRSEFSAAIAELTRSVSEATERCGEMETKKKAMELKFAEDLSEKDKVIESLKKELHHANDLLKEMQHESLESAIAKIAPTAAVASRLIRTDMSLTELYSLYVTNSEELENQKRENARLNLRIKTIIDEVSVSAPNMKKVELELSRTLESNNFLLQERDEILNIKTELNESLLDAQNKLKQYEREIRKQKQLQIDLSRQVCFLLKEVEQLRLGLSCDNDSSIIGEKATTEEVISKKLVTFRDSPELLTNNQKLLVLVRDLSSKLEETERDKQSFNESKIQEKLENYKKKVNDQQQTIGQQSTTISTLLSKSEKYKKLYFDLQKNSTKSNNIDISDDEDNDTINRTIPDTKAQDIEAEKRIRTLDQQLHEVKGQYKTLKEQYEYYANEKKNNEKIMNEQFDSMRSEVRSLTSTNCKLVTNMEHLEQQIKLQQKNISAYKQQIAALEDRNKNYETTIIKHEHSIQLLREETMKTQVACSSAESQVQHLKHENRILKDTNARLSAEKESFYREQERQNLLFNNVELIKANLERSESERRMQYDQRFDELNRELSAQRCRNQEEEDRFRETIAELKRETDSAKQRMEEEKLQADKLRNQVIELREELSNKSKEIDTLSKKLRESLTPLTSDNPIAMANKKVRDIESKYEEAKLEIDSISKELNKAREHSVQYYNMSQSAETEIKNLHELHKAYEAKAEAQLKELKSAEQNYKSKITELEAQVQLATITNESIKSNPNLKKTQDELKEALLKLTESTQVERALREEKENLLQSLTKVEQKYAKEMELHSADLNDHAKIKSEYAKIRDQIESLTSERNSAKKQLSEMQVFLENSEELLRKENEDLTKRINEMNEINTKLHEQIEALTVKLSVLSRTQMAELNTSSKDISMDTSQSNLNRSTFEDEKNSEQLLDIIKFLRKEKELAQAKLDVVEAEKTRLQTETTVLQKKLEEVSSHVNQERVKSDADLISATKHEQILRKLELHDALADSNRSLREERNQLSDQVKELKESIKTIENELVPLQIQNRDQSLQVDILSAENTSLRAEAIKWRQRANVLVEKSNKNPEEFKRLQTERENLAKMLTNEKEALKKATNDLNTIKAEKSKLEADLAAAEKQLQSFEKQIQNYEKQIAAFEKQIQAATEEKKKLVEELITVRQMTTRLTQEGTDLKNKLLEKEEKINKMVEQLEAKETQVQETKNKECQIRKIAKRYKDSYMELANKSSTSVAADGVSQDNEIGQNSAVESALSNIEQEQNRKTIDSLNITIRTLQEEQDQLKKENDDLKKSGDQTRLLLQKAQVEAKSFNEVIKQSVETHSAAINDVKRQHEDSITRLEKELLDQSNSAKETIARLTRDNEALHMRINQLNRQLGLQQSAKPSTSSVVVSDKGSISDSSPRTANVKPMSGATTPQQSATVTPWRGGETPLASIRPISVQNRTAAVLPTSQQTTSGGSSTSSGTSSSGCSNTALVPPQQQVHTTGSTSLESMSSSPTSSHTDYMPSTSSASVAVAAIPPMGSASAAESSQEAESMQQQQQNEPQQPIVSGGQQQVVALVSPRVECSAQNVVSPNLQLQQEPNNQQPSTSGTTSSTSHIAVSSHNRHTPSSSSVTTTQAGPSGSHKRPRDIENDFPSGGEDSDKGPKHAKRIRAPGHGSETSISLGVTDSGFDVEYQVPTSSQRDQEDDIVVVDSEDDDGMAEADDGPIEGDGEGEGYDDSYEQDQDMDENECPEVNESNIRADIEIDNNEVEVENQCSSGADDQSDANDASTSQSAASVVTAATVHSQQDNNQQSQTISSGSSEGTNNIQLSPMNRKQASSTFSRQQKPTISKAQQQGADETPNEKHEQKPSGSGVSDSSLQASKGPSTDGAAHSDESDVKNVSGASETKERVDDSNDRGKQTEDGDSMANADEADEDFTEEAAASFEAPEVADSESHQSGSATQSEIQDVQPNQAEPTSENIEGADGVSSEGEKQAVEEVVEEGREAEASTSINTRSKATRGSIPTRRANRNFQRGNNRTHIVWQDNQNDNRSSPNQNAMRGFGNQRGQRARRMRRPASGNYGNMRFS